MKYLIKNASITLGTKTVLDDINFEINDNNHIGIVGKNGEGKTTLLKALIDNEMFEEGIEDSPFEITKIGNFTIGCLNQMSFENENITLIKEIEKSFARIINLEKKMNHLLKEMEINNSIKIIEEYTKVQDNYINLGGYNYKKEYEIMLKKFGFKDEDKEKLITSFSGGEKTKLAFIKLLLSKPDILLLDEPTNHLDVEAIEWLENYLKNYKKSFVIVSHDRMFLNNTVNIIYDISYGKVIKYSGNYEFYEKKKITDYEKQLDDYERQQKEIARLRTIYEKFRSKPSKAKMALSKLHMIEKMDIIRKPLKVSEKSVKNFLTKIDPSGRIVFTCKNLEIGYDQVLGRINLEILKQQRIGIIGANGSGKSTFLKTINKMIKPIKGSITYGYNVKIGYFDQNLEFANQENSILEEFLEKHPSILEQDARSALGAFLFSGKDVDKKVKVLSGGEKVRLQLCEILYNKPNFLILDEPTNHMDIASKQQLEKILLDYQGTLIFVSHDRYFVKKLATQLLVFQDNTVNYYPYSYSDYLLKNSEVINKEIEDNYQKKKVSKGKKENLNSLRKELNKIEKDIDNKEVEQKELEKQLFDEKIYNDYLKVKEIEDKIKSLKANLENLNVQWEEIAAEILTLEENATES